MCVQTRPQKKNPLPRIALLACVIGLIVRPAQLVGQDDYTPILWWHPVVAAAGVALFYTIDDPLREFFQDVRSDGTDDVARVAKKGKEPIVFQVAGLGALGVGLIAQEAKVARTGLQILASYGLSSAMMIGTKWVFGRTRPADTPGDVTNFDWFNGTENTAFPSGTSAIVFSLATTVSDAVGHPAASVVMYSGATLTSWSRLNDNRHWMSDIVLGAFYGVTAAKLVNGRWRVFGLRPPTLLIGPAGQAGVQYRTSF